MSSKLCGLDEVEDAASNPRTDHLCHVGDGAVHNFADRCAHFDGSLEDETMEKVMCPNCEGAMKSTYSRWAEKARQCEGFGWLCEPCELRMDRRPGPRDRRIVEEA